MINEIESRLGVCRKTRGSRKYYDCPKCTVKDPVGQLVVDWNLDKFICNHVDSCGFAGTITKSLSYELGIRKQMDTHTYVQKQEPIKTKYKVDKIEPVEFDIVRDKDLYDPRKDRERQIKALFLPNSQLVGAIDSEYGNPILIDSEALLTTSENFTHFKVNAGGSKAEDIKDYRYTLLECDEIADMKIQGAYIKELGLPVASLTWSGNKSLHAVVKVEASSLEEYKNRVELIHEVCASVGFKVDKTKDCCRFTRLAGSLNNKTNRIQRLLEVNSGSESWVDWELNYLPKLIVTENVLNSSQIKTKVVESGFSSGFATHDYNDSGMKGANVTLLTGKRNQGKTTFSRQLVVASALQGIKSFVWYGEGDKEVEKGYFTRIIAREGEIESSDNGYGRTVWYANDLAEKRFDEHYAPYIDMYVKPIDLKIPVFDDLIARMTDKAKQGVRLFVIDNMMKLTADQKNTNTAQIMIIAKLKEFADYYNVHIVLIAHPRKGDGDQSISGAMEQENTADTILRFKRIFSASGLGKEDNFPSAESHKVTAVVLNEKVRNGGKQYPMYMEFDEVKQINIDIAYLSDLEQLASEYQEDGRYSRVARDCEYKGGKNVNDR